MGVCARAWMIGCEQCYCHCVLKRRRNSCNCTHKHLIIYSAGKNVPSCTHKVSLVLYGPNSFGLAPLRCVWLVEFPYQKKKHSEHLVVAGIIVSTSTDQTDDVFGTGNISLRCVGFIFRLIKNSSVSHVPDARRHRKNLAHTRPIPTIKMIIIGNDCTWQRIMSQIRSMLWQSIRLAPWHFYINENDLVLRALCSIFNFRERHTPVYGDRSSFRGKFKFRWVYVYRLHTLCHFDLN